MVASDRTQPENRTLAGKGREKNNWQRQFGGFFQLQCFAITSEFQRWRPGFRKQAGDLEYFDPRIINFKLFVKS